MKACLYTCGSYTQVDDRVKSPPGLSGPSTLPGPSAQPGLLPAQDQVSCDELRTICAPFLAHRHSLYLFPDISGYMVVAFRLGHLHVLVCKDATPSQLGCNMLQVR